MNANRSVQARFTDVQGPVVQVQQPNGGETHSIGEVVTLRWTAGDNVGVTEVDLLLSRDGEAGPFEVLASELANEGVWDWTVTGPGTTQAILKVVARDAAGNGGSDLGDAPFEIDTDITDAESGPVTEFALSPPRPNPIVGTAAVVFANPFTAHVQLRVLDVRGREVAVLADGTWPAGRHLLRWNGETPTGRAPAGVYFVQMHAEGKRITRRALLLR
jgi:hypothetical protein